MTLKNASKWMSVLSLSLVLAACGNGGGSTTEESSSADTTTEESAGGSESGSESSSEESGSEESESGESSEGGEAASGDFDTSQNIHVISREDGSGTRDAFSEIVGLLDENDNDMTTQTATTQNSTDGVIQAVSGDETAIGYASVGSLQGNDSVKPLAVNGATPDTESIQNGDYPIARNFNLTWGSELSEPAQDFLDFIMSEEGQAVVEEEGYVAAEADAGAFEGGDASGTVSLVGSTSVTPVIEALSQAYNEINPDVTFEITSPGSGAGVTAAIDGTADIGMASRELDEEEEGQVEDVQPIAIDGIGVIVNPANTLEDISQESIEGIYLGDITTWDEVQ